MARKLAAELIHRADQLMYDAKTSKAAHVYPTAVRVENGALVELPDAVSRSAANEEPHAARPPLRFAPRSPRMLDLSVLRGR